MEGGAHVRPGGPTIRRGYFSRRVRLTCERNTSLRHSIATTARALISFQAATILTRAFIYVVSSMQLLWVGAAATA